MITHLAAATDLVMVRMGTDEASVCCKGPWAWLIIDGKR